MKTIHNEVLHLFQEGVLLGCCMDVTRAVVDDGVHLRIQPQDVLEGVDGYLIAFRLMHDVEGKNPLTFGVTNGKPTISALSDCGGVLPRTANPFERSHLAFHFDLPMSVTDQGLHTSFYFGGKRLEWQ